LGERAPRLFFCLNILTLTQYVGLAAMPLIASVPRHTSMTVELRSSLVAVLVGLCVLCTSACAPSLSPLYRDYAVADTVQVTDARIENALEESGWTLASSDTLPHTVVTNHRTIRNWGLYRVKASLEVVPLGPEHVRVLIHPYRHYFTGSRSKIPFMRRSLQRSILPDLNEALAAQGLQVAGTSLKRDRQPVRR